MNRPSFTVTNTSVDGRDVGPRPLGGSGIRSGRGAIQERAAQVAVRFEHARSCPEDPTMQLFLTDLSPSLGYGGNPGNDPAGLRHPRSWRPLATSPVLADAGTSTCRS